MTSNETGSGPVVTVVMAAFNVGPYVDAALQAVRDQSLADLEIIVVDDGSTDDTWTRATAHAEADPRVRPVKGPGKGPGAARNVGLGLARGRWIAVVDADDLIEGDRLERLVALAEAERAEIAADNLRAFYDDAPRPDHPWLTSDAWSRGRSVTYVDLMRGGVGNTDHLGYLKPVMSSAGLRRLGLTYDESLIIGEDFDLIARWLKAGGRYVYSPETAYGYRRRTSSLSYRLNARQLESMVEALDRLAVGLIDPEAVEATRLRGEGLREELAYVRLVDRLKRKDVSALIETLTRPAMARRFFASVKDGLGRRLGRG